MVSTPSDIVTAAVVVIGDEILSGRTKDTNSGYIADHCTAIGIQLREIRVVPDVQEEIVAAINALREKYTYVFTTGGIGPTHDDITADAVAAAFDVGIDIDPRARDLLLPYFAARQVEVTAARMRMARIPDGADLIENTVSVAPGFWIGNVIVMAGVPKIMQVMLDAVTPKLRTGRKMHAVTIDVQHPEGVVAGLLKEHQDHFPDVSMGSYPTMRDHRPMVQLVLRSLDEDRLKTAEDGLRERLVAKGYI